MSAPQSLGHDVNVIEAANPREAWHLEDSLDFGWGRLCQGDDSYFVFILGVIHNAAERLRAQVES